MEKWEYKRETLANGSNVKIIDALNKFGSDGWEVIDIVLTHSNSNYVYYEVFFKRLLCE